MSSLPAFIQHCTGGYSKYRQAIEMQRSKTALIHRQHDHLYRKPDRIYKKKSTRMSDFGKIVEYKSNA